MERSSRRIRRLKMASLVGVGYLTLVILLLQAGMTVGYDHEKGEAEDWPRGKEKGTEKWEEKGTEREWEREEPFMLKESKQMVKTEAGEMRVVRSLVDGRLSIGFITMEPKTLFVPQYLDTDLIIFVRRGEVKVGFIYKDELAERRLKIGDVYRIPAGSAFYLVNVGEGQRLHLICGFDTSESLRFGKFQSFFIGGGMNPVSVLSGFDSEILENAFNVTNAELRELLSSQQEGPIVYISDYRAPTMWSKFLELKEKEKLKHMKRMVDFEEGEEDREEEERWCGWSWRKLLGSILSKRSDKRPEDYKGKGKSPDSYNLYNAKPDFKNNYGWSIAVDESTYSQLKKSRCGAYLVNLTAGSMMAPHLNPRATEYGVVLRGTGRVQIVYPNGTLAMDTKVKEGDVFWVPRYFPFCHVASRAGPMEFFGFTTSAHRNRPQFLAGSNSLLRSMHGPELAAAFGLPLDALRSLTAAQREAVILPAASAVPPLSPDHGHDDSPPVIKTFAACH